jgi:hypothetical protein
LIQQTRFEPDSQDEAAREPLAKRLAAAALVENGETLPGQCHAVNDYFPICTTPILHEMFRAARQPSRRPLRLDNFCGVGFMPEPDVGLRVDARPEGRGPRPPHCDGETVNDRPAFNRSA